MKEISAVPLPAQERDFRPIEGIFRGTPFYWVGNGFRVTNYFPSGNAFGVRMSPFYLLDYHPPHVYEPTDDLRRGVGAHPHRGMETVSIAYDGAIAHHDSADNSGIIRAGDVQWMTAGGGLLHREYHEASFARAGGPMHMLQIWVNLPRKDKMTTPRYQDIAGARIANVSLPDQGGTVRVIAGDYASAKGPADTFSPITMLDVRLNAGGRAPIALDESHNTGILVTNGRVRVNRTAQAEAKDFILFENGKGESIELEAVLGPASAVVLSGRPIPDPIVGYGPFLMNSRDEIVAAYNDFNAGKFGRLAD
jgi:redox-sensitive bicupin YhaK (pirin superfamily)